MSGLPTRVSEIVSELNAARWMNRVMRRPSHLVLSAPYLYWLEGEVGGLYRSHIGGALSAERVVDATARQAKLSVEEELERERTRNRTVGIDAFFVDDHNEFVLYRSNGKWWFYRIAGGLNTNIFDSFTEKGFPTNLVAEKTDGYFSHIFFTCCGNVFRAVMEYSKEDPDGLNLSFAKLTGIGGGAFVALPPVAGTILLPDDPKDAAETAKPGRVPVVDCGSADYIVAEEFGRLRGFWVHDHRKVLYTVSDTTHLAIVSITRDDGSTEVMPYPRVGQSNPRVALALYDVDSGTRYVLPLKTLAGVFGKGRTLETLLAEATAAQKGTQTLTAGTGFLPEYLPRIGWLSDGSGCFVMGLDRSQEHAAVHAISIESFIPVQDETALLEVWATGSSSNCRSELLLEQSIPWAWVEVTDACYFSSFSFERSSPGTMTVGMYAVPNSGNAEWESAKDEKPFYQLFRASTNTPVRWAQLTTGDSNVNHKEIAFGKLDAHTDASFYLCGGCDLYGSMLAYTTDTETVHLTGKDEYVYTFRLITQGGAVSGVAMVVGTGSEQAKLRIHSFADGKLDAGRIVPTTWSINHTADCWPLGGPRYPLVLTEFHLVKNSRGVDLPCYLYRPAGSAPLPVVVYVYGGPHVQLVRGGAYYDVVFNPLAQALVARGYAFVIVDNQMCHANHLRALSICKHNMGRFETEDYAAALKGLNEATNGLLDLSRVAITGWSYGGYSTLLAMSQAPDTFKLGFSGAPVADWRLYDTGYTERYMGLLPRNVSAYAAGSIHSCAAGFPDEPLRLFIAHGYTDENVHFSNTLLVANALSGAMKPYQTAVYAGERHSMSHHPHSMLHYRASVIATILKLL